MLYKEGILCKHFKGKNLLEKNIYCIKKLGVNGKDIDTRIITYSGDGSLESATDLVIYENIFQEGKLFTREYSDISSSLNEEKQKEFEQIHKVEPLTDEEIEIVNSKEFIEEKKRFTEEKFKNYTKTK